MTDVTVLTLQRQYRQPATQGFSFDVNNSIQLYVQPGISLTCKGPKQCDKFSYDVQASL